MPQRRSGLRTTPISRIVHATVALRDASPWARVGIALSLQHVEPASAGAEDVAAAERSSGHEPLVPRPGLRPALSADVPGIAGSSRTTSTGRRGRRRSGAGLARRQLLHAARRRGRSGGGPARRHPRANRLEHAPGSTGRSPQTGSGTAPPHPGDLRARIDAYHRERRCLRGRGWPGRDGG